MLYSNGYTDVHTYIYHMNTELRIIVTAKNDRKSLAEIDRSISMESGSIQSRDFTHKLTWRGSNRKSINPRKENEETGYLPKRKSTHTHKVAKNERSKADAAKQLLNV